MVTEGQTTSSQLIQDNMKKIIALLLFCSITIINGCEVSDKEKNVSLNNKGEIDFLPYLWKIPLHKDGNATNHNPFLGDNMVFGDKVLIPTTNSPTSRNITLIDPETGEIVWDWSDWFQPDTEGSNCTWNVIHDKYFHWVNGSRRYTIDITTGNTKLKTRTTNNVAFSSRLQSENDVTYMLSRIITPEGTSTNALFQGSIFNDQYEKILEAPHSIDSIGENNRVKSIDQVFPYSSNEKKFLVVKTSQPYKNWFYDQRVNLYDLENKNWVYKDIVASEKSLNNSGWAKIHNDAFYFSAGEEIFSYDILKGTLNWSKKFSHDFTFSGFEIVDNILIANCEDQRSYGINASNGQLIWSSEGSGTSSKLNNRVMNSVAYFSGGGPPYIYAKDIYNGKNYWALNIDKYEDNASGWSLNINVIPGQNGKKDKVIVLSSKFAYCFEAI